MGWVLGWVFGEHEQVREGKVGVRWGGKGGRG